MSGPPNDLIDIDAAHLGAAAEILAAAFATNPVFRWMAHDRDRLTERLPHCFASLLSAGLRRPGTPLHMTTDRGAAAIWHLPGQWKPSMPESARITPGFVRSFGLRLDRLGRTSTILAKAHPSDPHYYLAFVGARPEMQGSGLGSALLAPMVERCDREGVGAYLENSDPANTAFYERHGFVETGPLALPAGAPVMTGMWREPR